MPTSARYRAQVVRLASEIDLSCSDDIGGLGVGALDSNRIQLLVIDLPAVTFIDSTGLRALVRTQQAAWAQGKQLTLRNPSDAVWRVLKLGALDTVLTIEASA